MYDICFNKPSWYRIPEREHQATKPNKNLIEHYVQVNRVVARAGYFAEYHDLYVEQDEASHEALRRINRGRSARDLPQFEYEEFMDIIRTLHEHDTAKAFDSIIWDMRNIWLAEQYKKNPEVRNLRTLWFIDEKFTGYITGIRYKWIGKRIAPKYYVNESEPATLWNYAYQGLYVVHGFDFSPVLVHPLDITYPPSDYRTQ
jgi:hypothetical protein